LRLLAKAKPDPKSGCWVWAGAVQSRGYGCVTDGHGGSMLAHRASWELHNGTIPDGLTVDHRCQRKLCINPAHLDLVSHAVNAARGDGSSPLYCVNGHPLFGTLGEWTRRKDGRRRCRLCDRARSAQHRLRLAAPETFNENDDRLVSVVHGPRATSETDARRAGLSAARHEARR